MCSKETFNSLCYCLTLSKLNDHPDYQDWTVQKGRLECFEKAKAHLDLIYAQSTDGKKTQSGRLRKLIQDALSYQYFIMKTDRHNDVDAFSLLKVLRPSHPPPGLRAHRDTGTVQAQEPHRDPLPVPRPTPHCCRPFQSACLRRAPR